MKMFVRMQKFLCVSALVCTTAIVAPSVAVGQSIGIPNGFDLGDYSEAVVQKESSGDYGALNTASQAAGAYQFLPPPLVDLGLVRRISPGSAWSNYAWTSAAGSVNSLSDFRNTSAGHALQDQAFRDFTLLQWRRLTARTKSRVGSTVDGVYVTEGGLLSAAHFLGAGGLNSFVSAGFTGSNLGNIPLILSQNGFDSLAELDAYVMTRISSGAAAHGIDGGDPDASRPEVPSLGLTCFQVSIMDTAGEAITSPFGVDRTGIASAGYHVGLDMVNGQGRGAPLMAGITGTVVAGPGGGTNAFTMQTADGRQRFGFLHNDTVNVRTGDAIAPNDVVATMGDRGSPGAVHLHLMAQIRSDVVQSAAESIGQVWGAGSGGYGSKGAPLSSDVIASAGTTSYFVVNPEPFLHHRVAFRPALLTRPQYVAQGFSRPDGLTLENNCGPTIDDLDGSGSNFSQNGGQTPDGGITGNGTGAAISDQVQIALATEEGRDAIIEYGTAALGIMSRQQTALEGNAMRSATWATMLLTTLD